MLSELRRIEARKKERERKTQDLQKLIAGGEGGTDSQGAGPRKYKTANKNKKLAANKMTKSDSMVSL